MRTERARVKMARAARALARSVVRRKPPVTIATKAKAPPAELGEAPIKRPPAPERMTRSTERERSRPAWDSEVHKSQPIVAAASSRAITRPRPEVLGAGL